MPALRQALRAIKMNIQREANLMAFNVAFLIVGVSLCLASSLVWFCQRPDSSKATEAA